MPDQINYFKVGIFTFSGLVLFIAGLVVFGLSGSLFKERIECVTFYERSVQGLNVGSAVKFRGFGVGTVTGISLASVEEVRGQSVVKVTFEIDPKALSGHGGKEAMAENFISQQIESGLMVFMNYQGITGVGFLDLDYVTDGTSKNKTDTGRNWASTQNLLYVPSGPSRILEIGDAVTQVVKSLSTVDFNGISEELKETIKAAGSILGQFDSGHLSAEVGKTLEEIRLASAQLTTLLSTAEKAIGGGEGRNVGEELKSTMKQMRLTLKRLDQLFNSSQGNLPMTLDNLRVMSENLRELSELLKDQPSQVFFGDPPRPLNPEAVSQ